MYTWTQFLFIQKHGYKYMYIYILVQMDGLKLDGFTTTNAYHKGCYDDRKYLTKYVKQLDYHNTAGIKQLHCTCSPAIITSVCQQLNLGKLSRVNGTYTCENFIEKKYARHKTQFCYY